MIAAPKLNAHFNPFAGWDVRTLLEIQSKRQGDRTCLIWEPLEGESRRWSYRETVQEIARVGRSKERADAGPIARP